MSKFLDLTGVSNLWGKVKSKILSDITSNVTNKIGVANGIASLGSNAKLPVSQLPALKTINNNSIVGEGNISIDLSLYKIVNSLPTTNIDVNKIYLVLSEAESSSNGNVYTEYIYVNNKWEEIGKYKAKVDLINYVTFDDVATSSKNGVITPNQYNILKNLEENSYSLIADEVLGYDTDHLTIPVVVPGCGDDIQNIIISAATFTTAGVMTATDKSKIETIFNTPYVTNITSEVTSTGIDFNILYENIDNSEHDSFSIPNASARYVGLMTPSDKDKLNRLPDSYKTFVINVTLDDSGHISYTGDDVFAYLTEHQTKTVLVNIHYKLDFGTVIEGITSTYCEYSTDTEVGNYISFYFVHNTSYAIYLVDGIIYESGPININRKIRFNILSDVKINGKSLTGGDWSEDVDKDSINIPLASSTNDGVLSAEMYNKLNSLGLGGGNKFIIDYDNAEQIKTKLESLTISEDLFNNEFANCFLSSLDSHNRFTILPASCLYTNLSLGDAANIVFTAHTDTQIITLRIDASVNNARLTVNSINLETRDIVYTNEQTTNLLKQ